VTVTAAGQFTAPNARTCRNGVCAPLPEHDRQPYAKAPWPYHTMSLWCHYLNMDGLDPNGRVPVRIKVLCYAKERTCRLSPVSQAVWSRAGAIFGLLWLCSGQQAASAWAAWFAPKCSASTPTRKFRHVMSPEFLDARWVWLLRYAAPCVNCGHTIKLSPSTRPSCRFGLTLTTAVLSCP
jgi:hypothetical protein